jgi:RNA polymerase sigma factor (sigma-70 family)
MELRNSALRFARYWCTTAADAEDVAHDALVSLLRSRRPVHDEFNYLFVAVKPIALRANARERRRVHADVISPSSVPAHIETILLSDAMTRLNLLRPRERRALQMAAEGYTHAEIALRLRASRGVVGQVVARARRKLTHGLNRFQGPVSKAAATGTSLGTSRARPPDGSMRRKV